MTSISMGKRRASPALTKAFIEGASWHRRDGRPSCWLWMFDDLERPCSPGRLEGVHLISRQRIRNSLAPLLVPSDPGTAASPAALLGWVDDIVEVAEWDPRNAALGCEEHHRRFDSQMTPRITVPIPALPLQMLAFILDWGLESEAERKFDSTGTTLAEAIEIRSNLLTRYWGYEGSHGCLS